MVHGKNAKEKKRLMITKKKSKTIQKRKKKSKMKKKGICTLCTVYFVMIYVCLGFPFTCDMLMFLLFF